MPVTTTCPECRRDLRVPDNLLGTRVRCPHCRTEFTAGDAPPVDEKPPPQEPSDQPPDPLADTQSPPAEMRTDAFRAAETGSIAEAPVSGPMPLPPKPDLDLDDEDDDDDRIDELEREARFRRIERESYDTAKQRVLVPAIGLMAAGGICLAIDAVRIVIAIVQFATMPPMPAAPGAGPFGTKEFLIGYQVMSIGSSIIWGALVLYSGIKLKQLRGYGMVLAGSIIALLPCFNGCCIIGLPFAIWALVLIHDDQVRRHFA